MKKWMVIFGLLGAPIAQAADYDARLAWVDRVSLSPRVSGIIAKVYVSPGDSLKKGAALLELDGDSYRAQAAASAAAVARFADEAADAKKEFGRAQELHDRDVTSQSEFDQAKLAAAQAETKLREGRARLRSAQIDVQDSVLRAPFDAWVISMQGRVGENAVVALRPEPLAIVARSGQMAARFAVSADKVNTVSKGEKATVTVGNKSYGGKVAAVGLEPTEKGDYSVEVVFPTPNLLRAGLPAKVSLP